jgi:hypothetical protein
MVENRRRKLSRTACTLLILGSLVCMAIPMPVAAGAMQPTLPGGSSIKPDIKLGETTPIRLKAEISTINVRAATEADNGLVDLAPKLYPLQMMPTWFPAIAEVDTDITMENPTGATIDLNVLFPLASALQAVDWMLSKGETVPRINNLQVSVDGKPVTFTSIDLPNPAGADKPLLPWARFPVSFPADGETLIHLRYSLPPVPFPGIEMALYYVFQPAAGWDGPIGQVQINLHLPYPASAQTITGMPKGSMHLPPYYRASGMTELQINSRLEGNTASFWWVNLEPGAQDEFTVWLLRPDTWQKFETARTAARADPKDGRAWLDLASTYTNALGIDIDYVTPFGGAYLPVGIVAFQKAGELLPLHPAPHAGLALLSLAPYIHDRNTPPDVIQYVKDEYGIAMELNARDPSLMKSSGISRQLISRLENALYEAFISSSTAEAIITAEAVLLERTPAAPSVTPTSFTTPTRINSDTPAVIAQLPVPTAAPPELNANGRQVVVIILAGTGILLVTGGYLAWKRRRKDPGNKE